MTNHQQRVYIIEKFLKSEKVLAEDFHWAKEIRFAKRLLEKRPFLFWEKFELPFELNTLAFFSRTDGIEKMEEFDGEFNKLVEKAPESNYNPKTKTAADLINKLK